MNTRDVILVVALIVAVVISYGVLLSIPEIFLKTFEESCKETISKRDKDLEEKEIANRELRKWLFK